MYWLLILFVFLILVFSIICLKSNENYCGVSSKAVYGSQIDGIYENFSTELSWSPNPIPLLVTQEQLNKFAQCCRSNEYKPRTIYDNPLCDGSLRMNRLPNWWQSQFFVQNYSEPKKTFYDLLKI